MKRMKKMIALLVLIAVGLFTLAGCGGSGGGGGSGAPAEDKPVTLKLGFQANSSSSERQAAQTSPCCANLFTMRSAFAAVREYTPTNT